MPTRTTPAAKAAVKAAPFKGGKIAGKPTAAKAPAPKPEPLITKEIPKGFKLPKSLAACADLLYAKRAERLLAAKVVEELEKVENFIKQYLIDNLPKNDATGVTGKLARATRIPKEIPQVKDWPAFYAHIKKTGDFDLLQRRVGEKAINERLEAGKKVPGIEIFRTATISIVKA